MTELQQNTKVNVLETLHVFSSRERQGKYKDSVPFVHIPVELVAQWKSYRNLRDRDWYVAIWSDLQLRALDDFDNVLSQVLGHIGEDMADVPEILQNQKWIEIMKTADECFKRLR